MWKNITNTRLPSKRAFVSIALCMCILLGLFCGCKKSLPQEGKDDYYTYINNEGMMSAEIPAYRESTNAFSQITDVVELELKGHLENLKDEYDYGTDEQRLKDFYSQAINFEQRNARGVTDLDKYTEAIDNVESIDEYIDAVIMVFRDTGSQSLFKFDYRNDFDGSGKTALYLVQNDFISSYVQWSTSQRLNNIYIQYLSRFLELSGDSDFQKNAEAVYQFENSIRNHSSNSDMLPNAIDYCNRYTVPEACELFNNCDFKRLIASVGGEACTDIIIQDEVQSRYINTILTEENLPMLKLYAKAVLYNDFVANLTWEHIEAKKKFENDKMQIQAELKPKWQYALYITTGVLGMEVGKWYEDSMYDEEVEADITAITEDIINEYETMLMDLDWLEESSKQMAIKKLQDIDYRVCYGTVYEPWRSEFEIIATKDGGTLVENIINAKRAEFDYNKGVVGTVAEVSEWGVMPYVCNAYYVRADNSINVSVAMLKEPFYNKNWSYEAKLGGIGVTIAHEISHAFDRNGAQYALNGSIENWWSEKDFAKFDRMVDRIDYQYSALEVFDKTFVNGTLTVSENIADLGAINIVGRLVDKKNLSLDKAFRAYAQAFGANSSERMVKYLMRSDTHTPEHQRVNQALSNCDWFYEAYNIDEDDGMYIAPEDRVGIWK